MSYFYDDDDEDEDDSFVPDEEQDKEEQQSSNDNRSDQVRKKLEEMKKREQEAHSKPQSSDTGGKGQSGKTGGQSSQGPSSKGSSGGTGTPGGSGVQAGANVTPTPGVGSGAPASGVGSGATTAGVGGTTATGAGATAAGTGAAAAGTGAATGGAAATAGVAAGAAAAWPVLLIILIIVIIIVLIICFIGVFIFIQTMPGAVMEKLKDMARSVGNAFTSFFGVDSTGQVEQKKIYEVLDYLEEMEYDLKGYGFLTEFVGDEDDAEDDGVERDEEGKISKASSTYIMQYLISDNYLYTIKNFNVDTGTGTANGNWFFNIFEEAGNVLSAVWEQASSLWSNDLKNRTGMLAIYKDTGTVGARGELYKRSEMGYIKTDADAKELIIKKGWTNNPMKYSLDGWTGRYGMPLEFLLSIHMATMMPDLAYDMVDNFKTEVNILLHETKNGEVLGAYKTESGEYVEYETVSNAINNTSGRGFFGWIKSHVDEWGLNKDEAQQLLELGIVPPMHNPPECGCTVSGEEEELYYNNKTVYQDDDGYYYETYATTESGEIDGSTTVKVYLEDDQTPETRTVSGKIKTIGDDCKKYWKTAVGRMHSDNDYDYDTYVPYIESVTDHWYRDVYFVADENQALVDYDYDYEAVMRERWTLYETYGTDTPEKMGEYKLYPLKKDGDYAKNINEVYVEDETKKLEAQGMIDSSTMLFDGTYEDAARLTIHVAKKAETITIGEEAEDLNWEKVERN